jgi:hypothetical protein
MAVELESTTQETFSASSQPDQLNIVNGLKAGMVTVTENSASHSLKRSLEEDAPASDLTFDKNNNNNTDSENVERCVYLYVYFICIHFIIMSLNKKGEILRRPNESKCPKRQHLLRLRF